MNEYATPSVAVRADDNVVAALWDRERREPDAPALAVRRGDGVASMTVREVCDEVRALASGLIGLGVEPGSSVCVFSRTRREFTLVDYAILAAGCRTVPIYETDSPDQVRWVAGDSGAVAIVAEDETLRKNVDEVRSDLPAVANVFVIEEGGLDELKAAGAAVAASAVDDRSRAITHEQLASIVYTSGTTGRPKGCMITHGNIIHEVRGVAAVAADLTGPGNATLMFLPLAHVLARVIQFACVTAGVEVGYATSLKHMTEEMPLFRPTWIFAVPRVFEKIYEGARQKAGGGVKGRMFSRASTVSIATSRGRQEGRVPPWTAAEHALFDRLVYAKLREAMGGRLRYAISGGAPLGERLGHFFNGLGLSVLEGYGLTETCAAATANAPGAMRVGTVGRPIPGNAIRIADDDEILIRGPVVFPGYWNNSAASADVLGEDGWLSSGDLGALDDDGFLRITGRKKDLIITAGGKNVQPAELEDVVSSNPVVAQAMVIGDGKPFIAALITLDVDALPAWVAERGRGVPPGGDLLEALATDPEIEASVRASIDEANALVSRAESIREFRILSAPFTIEGGELTPTLKVRRAKVLEKYAHEVAAIYGEG
jgi:long-chain acyl-CoA synthetase